MTKWGLMPSVPAGARSRKLLGQLEDFAQEQSFQESAWRSDAHQIRIALVIGFGAFLASLVLEFFRVGQGEAFFWSAVARSAFLLICFLPLFASFRKKPGGLLAWSLVAAAAALSVCGAVTILIGRLPWQDYAAITAMMMVYMSVFLPNQPLQAMLSAAVIAVGYVGLLPFASVEGNVTQLIFVEGVVLLTCMAAIRSIARARRATYLQSLELKAAQEYSKAELNESEFQRQTFEEAAAEGITIIEELALTREDAERQSTFLRAVLDNISRGVCVFDKDLKLAVWNQRLIKMLEIPDRLLKVGTPLAEIMLLNAERGEYGEGDPRELAASRMEEIQSSGEILSHHYERRRPCGMVVDVRGNPMPGGGLVTTYSDITERKKAEEVIQKMALRDPLTGIANRNAFSQRLQAAIENVGEKDGEFALALFDLDDFKPVNDQFGHPVGDALLCHVTELIGDSIRDDDLVARLGGDEFAVILSHVHDRNLAEELVRRIVEKLARPVVLDGHEIQIGASAGISMFPSDASDAEDIIRRADQALYAAKAGGKNQLKLASGQ